MSQLILPYDVAGEYILQVFANNSTSTHTRITTLVWTSPVGWHLPGQTARVVHAELLPTGDVIVVVYRPESGLDVILLPEELFLEGIPTTSPQSIVFPNVTVPWHPTLSTEAYNWTWTYSDTEVTTPITYPQAEW